MIQPKPIEVFSSDQWFAVLDSFLAMAVEDMLRQTHMVEHYVVQLMLFQTNNKKRHVSIEHNWSDALDKMAFFLFSPNIESFGDMLLDRGYVQAMLKDFLSVTKGYGKRHVDLAAQPYDQLFGAGQVDSLGLRYHRPTLLKDGGNLMQCVMHVQFMYKCILDFKGMLVGNYMKYMRKASRKSTTIKHDDLMQEYFLAANKAINHFHPKRGTFKAYQDVWMRKIYLRNVPGGDADNQFMEMPLDDLGEQTVSDDLNDVVNEKSSIGEIRRMAEMIDPNGYVLEAIGLSGGSEDGEG